MEPFLGRAGSQAAGDYTAIWESTAEGAADARTTSVVEQGGLNPERNECRVRTEGGMRAG